MPKPDTLFKQTTNRLLDLLADRRGRYAVLPTEETLAELCEVSRTTIRAALLHLENIHILERKGRTRSVGRRPRNADYFEVATLVNRSDHIESVFMERILRGNLTPGQHFSELEIAREAGVSTAGVREFLIAFSRYGLIQKQPRGGWRLCAFDAGFAKELADMRDLLELQAIECFAEAEPGDPVWDAVARLAGRHRALKPRIEASYNEFPSLDRELHTLIIERLGNRFARSFYDIVSFVFHYHYQWNKSQEMLRNRVALDEHLAILDALERREIDIATAKLRLHLDTARRTLLQSISASRAEAAMTRPSARLPRFGA